MSSFAEDNRRATRDACPCFPCSKHRKNRTPILGNAIPVFGYEPKAGVVRILVIFQGRPMFSHINGKLSPKPFE